MTPDRWYIASARAFLAVVREPDRALADLDPATLASPWRPLAERLVTWLDEDGSGHLDADGRLSAFLKALGDDELKSIGFGSRTRIVQRLRQAVEGRPLGDAIEELAAARQAHDDARDAELAGEVGPAPEPQVPVLDPFIDWSRFWSRDRTEAEWLIDDILARGRGHSIYAPHKVGKSLLALWCATRLAQGGVIAIYLDYEMGEEDLYERLSDMGHGPDQDLSLLRYALLPSLPPLDQPEGAAALLGLVDQERAAHPDRHVAVVIDTIGRATVGDENSADTIRDFYRHTGLGLKQRGVTWARLDHAGWDASKGARGSSSKGDDVDVIWRLAATDGGLELHRQAARMGWVPEKVTLNKVTDPVLRFVPVAESWPIGTNETARQLDRLAVPIEAGWRVAQAALQEAGEGRRSVLVRAAQKYRRMRRDQPDERRDPPPDPPPTDEAGPTPGPTSRKAHNQGADPPPDPPGPTPAGQMGPTGGPVRDPGGPRPNRATNDEVLHDVPDLRNPLEGALETLKEMERDERQEGEE